MDTQQIFSGRTETLSLLKKRVMDLKEGYRQNVALLGPRYVGKSSVLEHFISNLDDEEILVIYLDLEQKDFHYFYSKFITSLLYNFAKIKKLPLQEDLNLLLETTKPLIPQTVEVIKKIRQDFTENKIAEAYLGLLTLPEVFTNEAEKFCVLILDEFQNLEDFPLKNVFQNLGNKIMTQKRCLYVISSSYQNLAKKILAEKLSLLFGNFEMSFLEPFDLQNSQAFIEHNLKSIKVGAQLRNFLTDFTGGHPLSLNLICQELINLSAIHKQNEIFMPLMAQAIENTIFEKWGVLSRHFELIINEICQGRGNRGPAVILMALSNGKHKIVELLEEVKTGKNQLTQKLNRLLDTGVIVKNENFYYFKDKLFKYWIKYVYQKRMRDIELSPDKQRKQFKEEFNRCFENFNHTARKDFSLRIMELLHCFDNEAFQLNGRTYKLPVFRELELLKFKNQNGGSFDVIKASSDGEAWFIVPKKDNLAEHDVQLVLSESKSIARNFKRCLIISLSDLDENTRLKALQERCWIWNEGELNALLNLFDKPYILK